MKDGIAAVGRVVPRTQLAADAGLQVDNGIVVDAKLESSGADVFAAGDVANAWHPFYRRPIRVEHWANALNQAPPPRAPWWASPSVTKGSPTSSPTSTTWA